MAEVDQSRLAHAEIRDQPISARLRRVLLAAAEEAGVDVVSVFSGGQPGSTGRRTGSHRHDGGEAADLQLIKNHRTLDFADPQDREIFSAFVTAAAAHGASGIGAGLNYMSPMSSTKIHVGFGKDAADKSRIVWGDGGARANAPAWLREAAERGWRGPRDQIIVEGDDMSSDSEVERFRPMLDFIAKCEGTAGRPGDGYNTSLAYGKFLPGGREHDLVSKTLAEIDALGTYMLRHPANRYNSSALGRYQIVRTTLRGLKTQLRLSDSELFSPELQDRLAVALLKRRGPNVSGLRNEWASLQKIDGATLLAKYDEHGRPDERGWPEIPLPCFPPRESSWPELKAGDRGESVERLQRMLEELRYYPGKIDGKFGNNTRGAVALFQIENNLQITGAADEETWAALLRASPRPISEERGELTIDDLRKQGSQTIKNADRVRQLGWLTGALGLGGLGKEGANLMDPARLGAALPSGVNADALLQAVPALRSIFAASPDQSFIKALDLIEPALQKAAAIGPAAKPLVQSGSGLIELLLPMLSGLVPGPAGSLLSIGLGVAFHLFGSKVMDRRLQDQRSGKHFGS